MKLFTDSTIQKFKYRGNFTFRINKNTDLKTNEGFSEPNSANNLNSFLWKDSSSLQIYLTEDNIFSSKYSSLDIYNSTYDLLNLDNKANNQIRKKNKYLKLSSKINKLKKNVYNIGRWTEEEHRRFIEAILKYGNEWKAVQKHIKTRSSTQSRSHSQKFFLKIKNYDIYGFKDRKPCISSLNELSKNMTECELEEMVKLLISYEYNDSISEKKANFEDKVLNKKRSKDILSGFDLNFEDEMYNLSFPSYKEISRSNTKISTKTNSTNFSNKESITEENVDEFKNQFYNVFSSQNRRNSFEDNLVVLYADCILIDKSRRKSISKLRLNEESDNDLINSFIEFDNYIC